MEKLSIFSYLDYRNFLKERIKHAKSTQESLTQAMIAEALRVKGPFLSKVISGRANFNDDQLYLLSKFFELDSIEENYLNLLSHLERTGLDERKKKLLFEINSIQKKYLSTEESINTQKVGGKKELARNFYYLDPHHLIVHVCLAIDKFSDNPLKLARVLNLSESHIEKIIKNLTDLELVYNISGKYVLKDTQLHLKSSEYLCVPHQNLLRQLCSLRTMKPHKLDYNIALTFTGTEEDKEKIKSRFLEFLKEFDHILIKARDKHAYQMNFDLFRWV